MVCLLWAPSITNEGSPPCVQQFDTTVFNSVSVKARLFVALVCIVVGIPAVSTGFAPAVPDEPVLLLEFVASQALKEPVLRAALVEPAVGITLPVRTASISLRNSFPFLTIWSFCYHGFFNYRFYMSPCSPDYISIPKDAPRSWAFIIRSGLKPSRWTFTLFLACFAADYPRGTSQQFTVSETTRYRVAALSV